MSVDIAFIALGSNLGDRASYLSQARSAIASLPGTRVLAESSVEETEPIGPKGQGAYLNQMIAVETELSPRGLLHALHRIENQAGRERSVHWGPRTLDLDIVRFERQSVNDADLVIPHPAIADRDFWRREIAELQEALLAR